MKKNKKSRTNVERPGKKRGSSSKEKLEDDAGLSDPPKCRPRMGLGAKYIHMNTKIHRVSDLSLEVCSSYCTCIPEIRFYFLNIWFLLEV